MNISTTKTELQKAFSKLIKTSQTKTQTPLINYTYISAGAHGVILHSTDMEVGIKTTITASVNAEGEGLFPTSEVSDIISVIDEGRVDIEVAGPHINIKSEKGTSFDIPTLPFQEYPSIPENRHEDIYNIKTQDLKMVLDTITYAINKDQLNLIEDFEKSISLAIIDEKWKNHLRKMDELKQSVQLAVHEQKDPLLIYKFEAYELFKSMIHVLNKELLSFLFKSNLPNNQGNIKDAGSNVNTNSDYKTSKEESLNSDQLAERARSIGASASQNSQKVETITRELPKIGRNEKVEIRNSSTGEIKTLKFKQAEKLLQNGEWEIKQ